MKEETTPKTIAERVRAFEERNLKAGGMRMPGSILPADVATAIRELIDNEYAENKTQVIIKAVLDARAAMKPKPKVKPTKKA
ncbi:hypothetical protein V8Z74_14540 [Comamonas sp. w2-DMI]|uniref:hypothetical protein n=1 Tax=Comamonas sp. w2-DMI TaxID=3126391 RepID=UPI0032E4ACA7